MSAKIIDTNDITTDALSKLKADGVDTIGRYLTTSGSDKLIRPPEARAIAKADMKLFLVFEVYGGVDDFVHGDITAASGAHHADFVRDYASSVGAPDGVIIYFAIDTDAGQADFVARVDPYLRAVNSHLRGRYRTGLYANGYCCARALDEKLVVAAWLSQSMGWRGSRAFRASNRWALLQGPETKLHGLSIDTNTANPAVPDFGAFVPFEHAATAPGTAPGAPPSPKPDTPPPPPPPPPANAPDASVGLAPDVLARVVAIAAASGAAHRPWSNGDAPIGYLKGMAVAYAILLSHRDTEFGRLASHPVGTPAHDVLSWYAGALADHGVPLATDLDRLRATVAIMIGLGMRESDGNAWEGWDREANRNELSADSAEAGAFQMSWDAHEQVPAIAKLFEAYRMLPDDPEKVGPVFHEGVHVTERQLENYGGGDGAAFQRLAKASPMFAVATTAIGLRAIGGEHGHWGPIRRREAQLRSDVVDMLRQVEGAVGATA